MLKGNTFDWRPILVWTNLFKFPNIALIMFINTEHYQNKTLKNSTKSSTETFKDFVSEPGEQPSFKKVSNL